jgi:curved DNA-binding protein CbpA
MSRSGASSDVPAAPPLRGSLAETPLPQILRWIFVDQLRGTLTLTRGADVRRLYFEKGELRTATSSREPQRIGQFLRRRGKVSDADLSWAVDEIARQKGSRLGRKLVERGLLTRPIIDAEMKRLVEEIVFSAFEWESGEYRFEPSSAVLDPDIVLSFSTAAIIVEGIRRLPENPVFRERLGEGTRVLRLAREPMSRYQYLPLAPQEAYVLSRIDGLLDVDSLLVIAGSSRGAAAKMLYALLSCGLVEWKTDGTEKRASVGTVATLNVDVSSEPQRSTPGHAELVRNTWRRIDWLSHYELLGVAREATADDLRRAYLEKSRLFHPDLRNRPDLVDLEKELTAVFERLRIAYETLADPAARAEYDRQADQPGGGPVVPEGGKGGDPAARALLARRNFEHAMDFIAMKDYFPAIELLHEAVHFAPEIAEYRFRLGEAELKNAKWVERGLENLKAAAKMDPPRADLLRATARALLANGRKREAEPFARRAHELEPGAESAVLLTEVTGRPTVDPTAPAPRVEPAGIGGFLSRVLRKRK